MPTERRIRSSGYLESGPITEAWVIAAGTSTSDSTPPRLSARKNNSGALDYAMRRLDAALRPERDHPTKGVHLVVGQGVIWMRGEAGIHHLGHSLVGGQKLGDRHRVGAVPLHPHRQGLDATQHQEGVEGTRDWSSGVLQESEPFMQLGVPGHQRPADDIGVTAEIFGRRVEYHVGAVVEGALQIWSGECVVHHELRSPACAILAMAAMSATRSSGLLGVSSHTSLVWGRIAAATDDGSVKRATLQVKPCSPSTLTKKR